MQTTNPPLHLSEIIQVIQDEAGPLAAAMIVAMAQAQSESLANLMQRTRRTYVLGLFTGVALTGLVVLGITFVLKVLGG